MKNDKFQDRHSHPIARQVKVQSLQNFLRVLEERDV